MIAPARKGAERQWSTGRPRQIALGIDVPEGSRLLHAFGQQLSERRYAAGFSQATLAARSFMRPDQISGLERGVHVPTLPVLLLLSHALDCSVGDLTAGLAAPMRHASRRATLKLMAGQPMMSTAELADVFELPRSYVMQTLAFLNTNGVVESSEDGWRLTPARGVAGSDGAR